MILEDFWPTWNAGISQSSVYATAAPDLSSGWKLGKNRLGFRNRNQKSEERNQELEIRNNGNGKQFLVTNQKTMYQELEMGIRNQKKMKLGIRNKKQEKGRK